MSKIIDSVGFTGTQRGLARPQLENLQWVLQGLNGRTFHHGDCVGGDAQAHRVARALGYRVVLHAPENPMKRAFCEADEVRAEAPYLVRNKNIVKAADVLVGCPGQMTEQLRSGTWSTIRYARSTSTRLIIILPDGSITGAC